jgi:hypothetical protein
MLIRHSFSTVLLTASFVFWLPAALRYVLAQLPRTKFLPAKWTGA